MPPFVFMGQRFDIEPFPVPSTKKLGCAVYPEHEIGGFALTIPHATRNPGPLAEFDSEEEAIAAGRFHVMTDFLRASLLQRFMQLVQYCEENHQGQGQVLVIPLRMLPDWRNLRQSDWEAEHWEGEDQDLTSLDRSNEVFLAALRRRLARVGIVDVEVDPKTLYMRVYAK